MSPRSKKEYTETIFLRYKKASRKEKKLILNEFAYSGDIGHRFRFIPAISSGPFRPAVPGDSGRPVGAERRWSENIFDRKIRPSQALISSS